MPLSVDALADELLAAIRDHPNISLDPSKGPNTARLCIAYNRLYCELHDKELPPISVLPKGSDA